MAYEKRAVRPFNALDRTQKELNRLLRLQSPPIPDGVQAALGNTGVELIGVKGGSITDANGTLQLDSAQYMQGAIGLYFGTHDDHWMDLTKVVAQEVEEIFGYGSRPPLSVVITATNRRLKQVHTLRQWTFDDWRFSGGDGWRCELVAKVQGKNRPRPFRMPADGCVVSVLFMLHDDVPVAERIAGRPWRKGSWLARADFRVTASVGNGLAPRPMTAEIRERYGLGEQSTFYVHFLASSANGICGEADLSKVLAVYIDEDLLKGAAEMNSKNDFARPAGGALLNHWVMDTYRALVFQFLHDEQLDEFNPGSGEARNTYLFALLSTVGSAHNLSEEEALLILKEQPFRFLALLEHHLAMKTIGETLLELKK